MQSWNAAFFLFFCWLFVGEGGGGISGRVRALNLTVPLGSGRVGSDNLGYGPGSGFSFDARADLYQEPLNRIRCRCKQHLFDKCGCQWQYDWPLSFPLDCHLGVEGAWRVLSWGQRSETVTAEVSDEQETEDPASDCLNIMALNIAITERKVIGSTNQQMGTGL